jgi:hypothetical protein
MESFSRVGATAAVVIASLIGASTASAVVSSDTLADPDCNSIAHEETVEYWDDGHTVVQPSDGDWGVTREVELEATGKRNSRELELDFYGWHAEFGVNGLPQPAVARNFFYNQGDDEWPATRETTVVGESSATVRLHLGDKRIIELGTFKPKWDGDADDHNGAGGGFGGGTGAWHLAIPLRQHLKALRKHEFKAKGSRVRVSLDYSFPATRFVRSERMDWGTGTQTRDWTSADCELRSRRLRLSIR